MSSARFVVVLIISSGSLLGCLPRESSPLADSTIVNVLADLHLVDAEARTYPGGDLELRRDSVFAVHGIRAEDFNSALLARQDDLDAYLAVYDAVLARLNEKRQENTSTEESASESE